MYIHLCMYVHIYTNVYIYIYIYTCIYIYLSAHIIYKCIYRGVPQAAGREHDGHQPRHHGPRQGNPSHPGANPGANHKSISHRFCLREVAFQWELAKQTIFLPLGCLQGGLCCPTTCHTLLVESMTATNPAIMARVKVAHII